jgi:hypothetical protein
MGGFLQTHIKNTKNVTIDEFMSMSEEEEDDDDVVQEDDDEIQESEEEDTEENDEIEEDEEKNEENEEDELMKKTFLKCTEYYAYDIENSEACYITLEKESVLIFRRGVEQIFAEICDTNVWSTNTVDLIKAFQRCHFVEYS